MRIQSPLTSQQLALLFGAALVECFPSAQLIAVSCRASAFALDVAIDCPWDKGFLPLIEKKCLELSKRDLDFEALEMAPAAAAGLLAQKNQKILCGSLPKDKRVLVDLLRLSDFALPMKFDANAPKAQEIVFDEARKVGQGIYRFRASFGKRPSFRPHYFFDGFRQDENGWSYLPNGEKARLQLQEQWKRIVCEKGLGTVSTPMGVDWDEAEEQLARLGVKRAAQVTYMDHGPQALDYGPLSPAGGFQDQFYIETSEHEAQDEVISSLQMMREISNIFCFETKIVMRTCRGAQDAQVLQRALASEGLEAEHDPEGPDPEGNGVKLEFRILDVDGFTWPGPTLQLKRGRGPGKQDKRIILGSIFGPWERWIALACQRDERLPLLLEEEQARVMIVRPECRAYAEEVIASLKEKGLKARLDKGDGSLSARMHLGIKEDVPYLIVVGPKEAASGLISWRKNKDAVESTTTIDEFVQRLAPRIDS